MGFLLEAEEVWNFVCITSPFPCRRGLGWGLFINSKCYYNDSE